MSILVCVKQVPDTTEIRIDPATNTLIRSGVPSIVNPFDAYALETAVRLKERTGGTVTVISMGPAQAAAALRECLSVGADRAVLVTDRAFGGSDTLATSYILSGAIRYLGGFDIIFCGKQAIDGDTGQVGPEIAEHLGLAQVTYVCDVSWEDGTLVAKRENEGGHEYIQPQLPAVLTVIKTDYEPRYPTIKSKMAANKAKIETITAAELNLNAEHIGLKGSPTKVKKTFVPQHQKNCVRIQRDTAAQAAQELLEHLAQVHLL